MREVVDKNRKVRVISSLSITTNFQKVELKFTTTIQKLLMFLSLIRILKGRSCKINQRIIAKKFNCHYNSIIASLDTLNKLGFVRRKGREIFPDIETPEINSFILLLSQRLLKRIERKYLQSIFLPSNEFEIRIPTMVSDGEYNLLENQVNLLIKNRKKIAKRLANKIIEHLTLAQEKSWVSISEEDFEVIIIQQLESVPKYFSGITDTWFDLTIEKQRRILKAKLGEL